MRALIILMLFFIQPYPVLSSSVTDMVFISNEPDEQPRRNIQDRIMTAFTNSFVVQNNERGNFLINNIKRFFRLRKYMKTQKSL